MWCLLYLFLLFYCALYIYRHSYSGVLLLQSLTQYIKGYLVLFSVSVILFADLCLDDENSATRCVKSTNTIVQIKSKIGALEEIGTSNLIELIQRTRIRLLVMSTSEVAKSSKAAARRGSPRRCWRHSGEVQDGGGSGAVAKCGTVAVPKIPGC